MSTERKPFPVRLNDEDLKMLDDVRRIEPDIPTRPEMLRRLIERASRNEAPGISKRTKR